jgi:transposase
MDQHRAQISAEWIDTITGEISRARVAPADRAGVRKFLADFKGAGLEVALEATTGWRFVVEELQRLGAEVHLAEVVQTSGLKGRGKRAKTDWADARHLRELLLIGRLPESWIAPAHLLDLRAGFGAGTHSCTSARSGSSGCRRCSTTTAARTLASSSRSPTASGSLP